MRSDRMPSDRMQRGRMPSNRMRDPTKMPGPIDSPIALADSTSTLAVLIIRPIVLAGPTTDPTTDQAVDTRCAHPLTVHLTPMLIAGQGRITTGIGAQEFPPSTARTTMW